MKRRVPALGTAAGILPLIWLALCGHAWCSGHQKVSRPAVILEITRALDREDSARYGEMIAGLVRITLADAGVACVPAAPDQVGGFSSQKDATAAFLQVAREAGADFLLECLYTADPDGIAVELLLYTADTGELLARVSRQRRFDLNFDRAITDAVNELLKGAEVELARFEPAAGTPPAADPRPGRRDGDLEGEVRAGGPPRAPRFLHLELTAGGAPFFPLGAASDYFKIGAFSALGAAYRFDLGALVLGLGLEAGSSFFEAVGLSGSAETVLAPFGVLASCALSYGTPLEVAVRVSAGAALLSMAPSGLEDRLSKLLPYATGGVCLSLGFTPALGVILDTRFVTYFERSYEELSPLFGLIPTVCLYLRM